MDGNAPTHSNTAPIKIGIALGGGVARGWAHIGVLNALTRHGLRPNIIAGTSIGALVGGCYAAGKLEPLSQWASSLTKFKIVSYLDLKMTPGLIAGERLARVMRDHMGTLNIEHLSTPFVAVATDLTTGHELWLREGDLVDAIRASFALPGMFPPIQRGPRWLIDGALVNPVPVSVCTAMGADLTIAVNLNADLLGKNRRPGSNVPTITGFDVLSALDDQGKPIQAVRNALARRLFRRTPESPSLFGAMVSTLGIVLDRITRSRLAGDPPDIHLMPRLGHIGLAEFDRADEMIAEGEAVVERAMPDINDAIALLTRHGAGHSG